MQQMLTETDKLEIIEHEWAKARAKNPEVIMRVNVQDETDESGKPRVNVVIAFSGTWASIKNVQGRTHPIRRPCDRDLARRALSRSARCRLRGPGLRHTRRAVHGQAQGRGTTAAKLSPLCDRSGGDPVRYRGTSGRARAGCLDAGR